MLSAVSMLKNKKYKMGISYSSDDKNKVMMVEITTSNFIFIPEYFLGGDGVRE